MKRLLPAAALLLLLLLSACADDGPGSGSARTGTVRGIVLLGPTCPVESLESPCPDQPAEGVEVQAIRGEEVLVTAVSDPGGAFTMELEAGTYLLQAVVEPDGPGMFAQPTRVTVGEGAVTDVTVLLDTGIRMPVGASSPSADQ
jgi:hypothetical protein